MRKLSLISRWAPAAAALIVLSGPVQAQQNEITAEEATTYFEQLREEAIQIMEEQEFERMLEWTERNIADGAVFQASSSIVHGDTQKGIATITVDKDDMLRMSGMFIGAFRQEGVENYVLEVEVGEVDAHGTGAATVQVNWRESVTLDPAAAGAAAGAGATGAASGGSTAAGPVTLEQTADCHHLLLREEDRLVIGLSACTAEMRL